MGACQSTSETDVTVTWPTPSEQCPTVFELEDKSERQRRSSTRLRPNLVNIEFRRGVFEVYEMGTRIESGTDGGCAFVATHTVSAALPYSRAVSGWIGGWVGGWRLVARRAREQKNDKNKNNASYHVM